MTTRKSTVRRTATKSTRKRTSRRGSAKSTAQSKVEKAMHERKRGTLRSGSGRKVTSRKQAIAIGLSEARRSGAKVPRQNS